MSFRGFTSETAPPRSQRAEPGPVPTIGALLSSECKWMWAYCYPDHGHKTPCGHQAISLGYAALIFTSLS